VDGARKPLPAYGRALVGRTLASFVPGLLIMALAVVNAIPDFHQDRLVGKRNLVVRLGRHRAVRLYLALAAAGLLTSP
jgi:1,4-dihydroxy-2-naphthoate octaprenyltransferase